MKEKLLHYVWQHKVLLHSILTTTDGQEVEVLSPGLPNTDSGPDFRGAKVKIGGVLWVGNVEIHLRTSDWWRHHHDKDHAYDDIILHVVAEHDTSLTYPNGVAVPTIEIKAPLYVSENYDMLITSDHQPRCANIIQNIPIIKIHNWLTSLALARFELRSRQIEERRILLDKDWEATLFVTVARAFGFGINGEAFETWARSIPLGAIAKHRDNLFQIEAIFFGQAGLLENETSEAKAAKQSKDNQYFVQLQREYQFMKVKFGLTPISSSKWRFLRLRPQNFPHIRIAQLATLYYEQRLNMSRLINAHNIDDIYQLFTAHVSDYWRTHYTFSSEATATASKTLSKSSLHLLVVNVVVPMLFAYGRYKSDDNICDRAFSMWESLPAENNRVTRLWATAGVECESAADSQALLHLTSHYCDTHDCLRCQFGHEYVKHTPSFLCEKEKLM